MHSKVLYWHCQFQAKRSEAGGYPDSSHSTAKCCNQLPAPRLIPAAYQCGWWLKHLGPLLGMWQVCLEWIFSFWLPPGPVPAVVTSVGWLSHWEQSYTFSHMHILFLKKIFFFLMSKMNIKEHGCLSDWKRRQSKGWLKEVEKNKSHCYFNKTLAATKHCTPIETKEKRKSPEGIRVSSFTVLNQSPSESVRKF